MNMNDMILESESTSYNWRVSLHLITTYLMPLDWRESSTIFKKDKIN